MTADRAALVEKVARKLAADTCGKESEWPLYMRRATAAIDLIRADVLEEAAVIVEFSPHSHTAGEMCLMRDKAAAIRAALKGK